MKFQLVFNTDFTLNLGPAAQTVLIFLDQPHEIPTGKNLLKYWHWITRNCFLLEFLFLCKKQKH